MPPSSNNQASIDEQIGGAASIEAAVDLFYEKIWTAPTLADYFEGIDRSRLEAHQQAFSHRRAGRVWTLQRAGDA
ncbi:MAG: hypothetical protein ACRDYA_03705 [Egibacteraceae bacterium]